MNKAEHALDILWPAGTGLDGFEVSEQVVDPPELGRDVSQKPDQARR